MTQCLTSAVSTDQKRTVQILRASHFYSIANYVDLTAVFFFETGAMLTPTKSQNGTNCGSGGSFQS